MLFSTQQILICVAYFVRISALLFVMPFFGDRNVPIQVRILIAASLSIGFYGIIPKSSILNLDFDAFSIFFLLLKEVTVGVMIGYICKLMFEGIIMAANLVGYQMGFGTANLLMPGSDIQLNPFTALHRYIVFALFLNLGLHHIFINGVASTYDLIPLGHFQITEILGESLVAASVLIFTIALKLSAPILVSLLFTMAALGLIAKSVPQLNVFTLSFPLSFFVGLSIYMAMTPYLPDWLNQFYLDYSIYIENFVKSIAP